MTECCAQRGPLDHSQYLRIDPHEPQQHTTLPILLLAFDQHVERGVFQIEHAAEMDCDDPWLLLGDQQPYLLPDVFRIEEEETPFKPQQ